MNGFSAINSVTEITRVAALWELGKSLAGMDTSKVPSHPPGANLSGLRTFYNLSSTSLHHEAGFQKQGCKVDFYASVCMILLMSLGKNELYGQAQDYLRLQIAGCMVQWRPIDMFTPARRKCLAGKTNGHV